MVSRKVFQTSFRPVSRSSSSSSSSRSRSRRRRWSSSSSSSLVVVVVVVVVALLKGVSLFKAPFRSPQEITHFWEWRRPNTTSLHTIFWPLLKKKMSESLSKSYGASELIVVERWFWWILTRNGIPVYQSGWDVFATNNHDDGANLKGRMPRNKFLEFWSWFGPMRN